MNQRIAEEGKGGWDDDSVRIRGESLIAAIQKIWPVPAEAKGSTKASHTKSLDQEITLADLVDAELLAPGQSLLARGSEPIGLATVLPDGSLLMNGARFESPSGAAKGLRQKAINGWKFWYVDRDRGVTLDHLRRKLIDARKEPRNAPDAEVAELF